MSRSLAANARESRDPAAAARSLARLEAYAERHARILDPSDTTVPKRFLLLPEEPVWHGLGNQQLTLLYVLLAAMASGRALLGRPFAGAEDCYELPLRLDPAGFTRATGVELAAVDGYAELAAALRCGRYPGWSRANDLCGPDPGEVAPPRYVTLGDEGALAVWDLRRGIPHAVFAAVEPHRRAQLAVFGSYLLGDLARFMFRPGARIRAAAAAVGVPDPGRLTLGVQLRAGRPRGDLYLRRSAARAMFWEAAGTILAALDQGGVTDAQLFLATDSMAARAEARERFDDRLRHLPVDTGPDGDSFTAVVDQTLLASCDALVVTERSTFGYMAHLLSGVIPFAVDGRLGVVTRRSDSRSGLYRASRWEAPSTWPWQERALAECPSSEAVHCRELAPWPVASGWLAAWRWWWRLELPIVVADRLRRGMGRLWRLLPGRRRAQRAAAASPGLR